MDVEGDGFPQGPQGRIDRLEVENFKSYKGHQKIGPFKKFTAVIGPNGSGKSNLMDAISFVLGVRTQQLRGSLKELLYSYTEGGTQIHKPRKGYVKLVFQTPEGQEVEFSRVIQPSSSDPDANYASVYKVNDKTVSWDAYCQKLGTFGILVKVRNFLVFQVSMAPLSTQRGCYKRLAPPPQLTQASTNTELYPHINHTLAATRSHNTAPCPCTPAPHLTPPAHTLQTPPRATSRPWRPSPPRV